MAIDIESERLISFAKAARMFPALRAESPVSASTIWRWSLKGTKLPGGEVLRLESIRVAGRHMTSIEAVRRFLDAQNPTAAEVTTPATGSAVQQHNDAEQAAVNAMLNIA